MPMLKGVPVLACLVFAAACTTPQRPDVPRAAADCPRNRQAQQLPPAQPPPPPKPARVAAHVVHDAVAGATHRYPGLRGGSLPTLTDRTHTSAQATPSQHKTSARPAQYVS